MAVASTSSSSNSSASNWESRPSSLVFIGAGGVGHLHFAPPLSAVYWKGSQTPYLPSEGAGGKGKRGMEMTHIPLHPSSYPRHLEGCFFILIFWMGGDLKKTPPRVSQSERNSKKGCITCEKDGTATAQDWWKRRPAPHNTQIHAYTCIDTFITRSAWFFLHGSTVDGTSLILMCIQVYNIPKESGDAPCWHKARPSPFSLLSLILFLPLERIYELLEAILSVGSFQQ